MTVHLKMLAAGDPRPESGTESGLFLHCPSIVDQGPPRIDGFFLATSDAAGAAMVPVVKHTVHADTTGSDEGVFLAAFVCRKPGMAVDDFRTYSLNVHAPMDAQMPGLMRYEQYHPTMGDSGFDCMSLFRFADMSALETALGSDVVTAGTADLMNFIDPAASLVLVTKRHI